MPFENEMAALSEAHQYQADQVEIIEAIPEGIQLYKFPSHCDGSLCWCRPRVVFTAGKILLEHKDLLKGEFDC